MVGTDEQTVIYARLLGALASAVRPLKVFTSMRKARTWRTAAALTGNCNLMASPLVLPPVSGTQHQVVQQQMQQQQSAETPSPPPQVTDEKD